MLIKRRCTATGVINFFSKNEPFIAVGSVTTRNSEPHYIWHYHGEATSVSGVAIDWQTVERVMNAHHSRARQDAQAQSRHAA